MTINKLTELATKLDRLAAAGTGNERQTEIYNAKDGGYSVIVEQRNRSGTRHGYSAWAKTTGDAEVKIRERHAFLDRLNDEVK